MNRPWIGAICFALLTGLCSEQAATQNTSPPSNIRIESTPPYASDCQQAAEIESKTAIETCTDTSQRPERATALFLSAQALLSSGQSSDRTKALELIKTAADLKHAESLLTLTYLYMDGIYLPQSSQQASKYAQLACDIGVAHACTLHGLLLRAQHRYIEAEQRFQQGLKRGDSRAATQLALLYDKGIGVQKNPTKAMGYFHTGAMGGSSLAQFALYWYHYRGQATPKNYARAYAWLQLCDIQAAREEDIFNAWYFLLDDPRTGMLGNMLTQQQKSEAGKLIREYETGLSQGLAERNQLVVLNLLKKAMDEAPPTG